jgi:mono/diheme cytochrome c family protein
MTGTMIRITAALLFALSIPAAWAADEPKVEIKPGPGKEAVETNCNVCHSLDYIRINAGFLSPDGWKAEVAKMRGPFGASIDDQTAETVLHYLNASYGIAQKPAPAPDAKKEKREPR